MKDIYADIPTEIKQQHFNQLNEYKEKLRKEPELRSLFIEMTLSCNEHCLHCGSNCGDIRMENQLSDYEIIQTLIKLKDDLTKEKKKLPFINVTGGEPLLRPHLCELMKTISQLGYKWGMTSNGVLITPEVAKDLKDAGMYSIGISLDGLKDTHEWFRQTTGSYEKALEAVDNLYAAGIEKILLTTVVHKRNLHELDEIYEVVKSHNCKMWRIINVEPIGRALTNKDLMLSSDDYKYIINYIASHQEDETEIIYSCNHYLGLELERKTRPWYFFCRAGLHVASIQYNGDISACLDIERRPELVFGNVRKDHLLEIWENEFKIYREHKENKSKTCKKCEHKDNCQGGGYHTWDFDKNEPLICMMKELQN
ncbi:MAG: radical SAM protein [Agathobacter sp.]|nr:radical SAM protein [Agathobacter sp.]